MQLVIVGTGGHAKEVLDIARRAGHEVLGFFNDFDTSVETFRELPVFHDVADIPVDARIVLAIGLNMARRRESKRFADSLAPALVDPSAVISDSATLGDGTVVMMQAVVSSDAHVGEGVIVGSQAYVGHDNVVGDYTHVATGCALNGDVHVGNHCLLGALTSVKPGVTIGHAVTTGIGSVVIGDIDDDLTVVGNPARAIR